MNRSDRQIDPGCSCLIFSTSGRLFVCVIAGDDRLLVDDDLHWFQTKIQITKIGRIRRLDVFHLISKEIKLSMGCIFSITTAVWIPIRFVCLLYNIKLICIMVCSKWNFGPFSFDYSKIMFVHQQKCFHLAKPRCKFNLPKICEKFLLDLIKKWILQETYRLSSILKSPI